MNVISSFTSRAAGASFMTTGTLRGQKICRTATASSNSRYVRKHILELAPYTPILPFEVLSGELTKLFFLFCSLCCGDVSYCWPTCERTEKFGFLPDDIVKLDANENPYGPPPGIFRLLYFLPTSQTSTHLLQRWLKRCLRLNFRTSILIPNLVSCDKPW